MTDDQKIYDRNKPSVTEFDAENIRTGKQKEDDDEMSDARNKQKRKGE
jgi:hypothetical protein